MRGLSLLVSLFVAVVIRAGTTEEGMRWLADNSQKDGVVTLPSGLQYKVVRDGGGAGKSPQANSPCKCHYRGTLLDGSEFDSSYRRGQPATFAPNQVIAGWTEAMQLMRENDKWELFIPSELAYGDRATGSIPAGAVLVFELELLSVGEASPFNIMGVDFSSPKTILFICMFAFMAWQQIGGSGGSKVGPEVKLADASAPTNPTGACEHPDAPCVYVCSSFRCL